MKDAMKVSYWVEVLEVLLAEMMVVWMVDTLVV
jgi:hypothetical protein